MANKYPIYVISKGRFNPKTHRVLKDMNIDHKVCVEPSEYDLYKDNVSDNYLIKLPEDFSKRGQGSIPVRNWVWDNALSLKTERHWILDDNIEGFNRLNRNTKFVVNSDATFRASEDFTDRFENIALSGMNYYSFAKSTEPVPPFYINTRIYSCILINNKIPFRWRGKYNEDTDLSIRCLKDGWNTILFNAFLCGKITTMRNKGGNTDTIYNNNDNRRSFAESLQRQHPDIVKVVWKFNRWHHHVDYYQFRKRRLQYKESFVIPSDNINNYGMTLYKQERQDGNTK